ncbi:RusA family crossover junction endodeoxyribonuclease [Diaphorobacter caeni]|uniref:hypothetical protein n=1 Tax=Diaphorobacter caeni TaxID=2784387 RepID=UPI00188DDEF1|nr:hypothetical protein [Diaphorobacter caeni]MBF5007610.1 hypothetical protein [Diaphorobacter caeni]
MKIELPWPDRTLHPNARVHWAQLAKAKKAAREHAYYTVKGSGLVHTFPPGRIHIWIDFYPPDRRKRDDDGLLASMKAARDGIADALGVDDSRFVSHPMIHDTVHKGGIVRVTLTGGPTNAV